MNIIPHVITSEEEFSDFYCGAGGSSSGMKKAGLRGKVAGNHWKLALETHNINHPEIDHREVDLLVASPASFPYTVVAWFSPECTKHSRGQGKKRKNRTQLDFLNAAHPDPSAERSRVTMWDVVRFSEYHRYQAVIVENVVDVRDWEPYPHWLQAMVSLGYSYKENFLNSRFFHPLNGSDNYSPQNRDRLYVVFWRKGNRAPCLDFRPLAWCPGCQRDVQAVQVFKKPIPSTGEVLYDTTGSRGQYYYACPSCFVIKHNRPAARRVEPYYFAAYNIIDWSLPCPLIGERDKPLKPKTLNRIRIGLDKFGRQPLVIQLAYNHSSHHHSATMDGVMPTITKWQTQALLSPFIVNTSFGGNGNHIKSVADAIPSQTGRQSLAFILPLKGEDQYQHLKPSAEALPTQTASGAPGIVVAPALVEFYGGGDMRPVTDPMNTITAGGGKTGLIMSHYGRDNVVGPLSNPTPTLVGDGHLNLITPPSFIVGYYRRDKTASSLDDPIPTIPGENRFGLVSPPFLTSYYNGSDVVHGIDEPVYTISTNDRHSLVLPEINIDECGFRMLEPEECKLGQGFDRDYIILGSQKKDKVKQIGNAVSDPVAQWLAQAVKESLG
ncbi:MAG: DNA cytosine methyltransferase [Anaerolineae bacterium]|nr:DNA cytosine methyltransferase [Anaerolineae bacterium]